MICTERVRSVSVIGIAGTREDNMNDNEHGFGHSRLYWIGGLIRPRTGGFLKRRDLKKVEFVYP